MGIHQLIQFVQKCCFPAMILIILYRIRMKEKKNRNAAHKSKIKSFIHSPFKKLFHGLTTCFFLRKTTFINFPLKYELCNLFFMI